VTNGQRPTCGCWPKRNCGRYCAHPPTRRTASTAAPGPELFAPLATILPDLDGTRFALAGLSLTAGKSYLLVVASGLPKPAERFGPGWRPAFSWWVLVGASSAAVRAVVPVRAAPAMADT